MTDVTEVNGEITPLPARHNLTEWGAWAFVFGAAAVGFSYILPEGSRYDADGGEQAALIRAACSIIGDRLMAAGFLMWLAGRVIDAFRHPKHY